MSTGKIGVLALQRGESSLPTAAQPPPVDTSGVAVMARLRSGLPFRPILTRWLWRIALAEVQTGNRLDRPLKRHVQTDSVAGQQQIPRLDRVSYAFWQTSRGPPLETCPALPFFIAWLAPGCIDIRGDARSGQEKALGSSGFIGLSAGEETEPESAEGQSSHFMFMLGKRYASFVTY